MSVIDILTREPHGPPTERNPRNHSTYDLFTVAGMLGQAERSTAWLARYLDRMVAVAAFPAPFPLPFAGELSTRARVNSRWSRDAVDAWFDDRLTPEASARAAAADRAAASDAMAQAAERLAGAA